MTRMGLGARVEQFKSPMEITTLFLVLTIGFYVFLFWRSQIQARTYSRPNRRKSGPRPQIHPRRRSSDRNQVEDLVVNQLFEDEEKDRTATNH